MRLQAVLGGTVHTFRSVREVLGKANEIRSGDELAGVAACDVRERIAAKIVLAGLTLAELRADPAVSPDADEVSRWIEEGVDENVYRSVAGWSVAELREYMLRSDVGSPELSGLSAGLTSDMIAAVAKIMSNLDLMQAASKMEVVTRCRTAIGFRGTLASRAQPNHPADSPDGMLASAYEALSYGVGDAVIGINPVHDDAFHTGELLRASKALIDRLEAPTQNCVLAHVTTQMRAMRAGAPADLLFQSIAGTERANRAFGIDAKLLLEADAMLREDGSGNGPNRWYFETGQGSELSSDAHLGVDQVTLEARCYGFIRRFKPFMVNTVVGFIGPEYLYDGKQVTRAGLEDHFMGKLHGLPMGVDVCYTNHMKADQNDMDNLGSLLAAAGVNFLIGVPMADDCMLNYQSLGYHDIATLRELHRLAPAPAFADWMERMGLLERGRLTKRAGDAARLAKEAGALERRLG